MVQFPKDKKMEDVELLLSDEFVAFSTTIAAIHAEKKEKKSQLKEIYDKMKKEIEDLDGRAKTEYAQFEEWKKSQANEEA